MLKVWAVFKREMLELAKSPMAFVWTLALPIVLILLVGQLSFGGSSDGKFAISIPVVMQDNGTGTQQFIGVLKQIPGVTLEEMSLDNAKQHVETKSDRGGYILFPVGFSQAIAGGQQASLNVVTDTGTGGQIIRSLVQSVADRFNTTHLLVTALAQQAQQNNQTFDPQIASQQAITLQQNNKPAVTVVAQNAGGASFNTFDQVAPGYATMFIILGLSGLIGSVMSERTRGTMSRLAVMPLPKWAYMTGKMLAQFVIGFAQVVIMLGIAAIFFKAHINGDNILGIFLLILTLSFAATALGMLLASIFKTEGASRPIVTLIALIGSLVGGSWFPIWLLPEWVQQVSKVTINSWAMQGFNGLMIFGQSLSTVLVDVVALAIYGAICLLLAIRFFRYSETA